MWGQESQKIELFHYYLQKSIIPLNLDSSIRIGHRKVTLVTIWQVHMNILQLAAQKDEDRRQIQGLCSILALSG